jgi:hypothetical protein
MKKSKQTIELDRRDVEALNGPSLAGWVRFEKRTIKNIVEDQQGDLQGDVTLYGKKVKVFCFTIDQGVYSNWGLRNGISMDTVELK